MKGFIPLGDAMVKRGGTVDPAKHPDELFDLYSIPAYDRGAPDQVLGAEIGSAKQIVQPGDVLLSRIVPHIRRAWIVGPDNGRRLIASGEWIVFRSEKFDPAWLRHFLLGDRFHREFMATVAGVGGSLLRARPAQVALIKAPVLPLDEQRRIAAMLDQADTVRVRRRRVLAELDEIVESIFHSMFGSFSGKFLTVEEVAAPEKGSIRTGPFGSQLLHGEFVDEGIAVLGLDNVVGNRFSWKERRFITPEKYQQLRRYTVHPGDVLISIMGTCGRCVVVPADVGTAINTKHICAITVDQGISLPEFVRAAFLWHPRARQHLAQRTKGSVMDGLNMGIVKETPIPVPHLDDQHEFVRALEQVDTLTENVLRASAGLDDLFASLQSRAFSGHL